MGALYLKEIRSFLNSLIGYLVMGVFLLLTGLFMWVFPGDFNILDMGYANIDSLFIIAPWVFMFLIPAISMRMFSDEIKAGTIELLLTRPLSETRIVLAKYLSAISLVGIALLPTLVYYFSVIALEDAKSDVDSGAVWGSYLGLVFLSAAYTAIGIFASSVSSNQIVAFLLAAFLCFFFFIGFESVGSFNMFGRFDSLIISMGMNDHYRALSRGLIDSRDVVYFVFLAAAFLMLTKTVIQSRKW